MFPFVYYSETFVIQTFFFMIMVGVLATTFYCYFRAPRLGFSQVAILDLGMVGALTGILGGRIFHIFFEHPDYYLNNPIAALEFWRGGFVSFGAYIGGTLGVMAYLRWRKLPLLRYMDFVCLALPFMILSIRVGCLGAGCCFGKETDPHWWTLVFNNPISDAGSKHLGSHLYPTQVLDMINAVVIFAVLHWRYAKRRFDGEITLLFFSMYSLFRGLIEFLRGDRDRGLYFGDTISTGQITGAIFIFVCIYLYWYLSGHSKSLAESELDGKKKNLKI